MRKYIRTWIALLALACILDAIVPALLSRGTQASFEDAVVWAVIASVLTVVAWILDRREGESS